MEIPKKWRLFSTHKYDKWNEYNRAAARTLEEATRDLERARSPKKGRKTLFSRILPYLLTFVAGTGMIGAPNIPYFQTKETKNLAQYINDSAKEEQNYKKITYPAKIAERDSILKTLNPIDEIACEGCSLNDVRTYLEGKREAQDRIIKKLGYADIAAAKRIARRCSKIKTKYIPEEILPGIYFVENRDGDRKAVSETGCKGPTGISPENAKKLGGDPTDIRQNIKMADSLYADNKRFLEDDWKCLIAHPLGGTKTRKLVEISGAENYVHAKYESGLWNDKRFFGKTKNTRAMKIM